MRGPLLRVLVTLLSLGFYLGVCRWWAGRDRAPDAFYVCVVLWPALLVVSTRIWKLPARNVLTVGLGAAAFGTIWSLTLVDFPPEALEHCSPACEWLLVLVPILFTPLVGLILSDSGPLVAGLMIALADPLLLPVRMWNSNANVAGGWSMYPYPSVLGELILLLVTVSLGLGGGYLGSRLRRRCVRAKRSPQATGCGRA